MNKLFHYVIGNKIVAIGNKIKNSKSWLTSFQWLVWGFFLDELVSDFKCQYNYTPVRSNDSISSN